MSGDVLPQFLIIASPTKVSLEMFRYHAELRSSSSTIFCEFQMRLSFWFACCVCTVPLSARDVSPSATSADQATSTAVELPTDLLEPYRDAAEKKWSKSIREFDDLNRNETVASDAIMFIGSSSIRRWTTLATEMAPYRTIRRGYGGAKYTDMAVFVERILSPHEYRAS